MIRKLILALSFVGFLGAEDGLYAQQPTAGNSLAPASGPAKKDAQDDKREELKSKLLKRKMELDGERIQAAPHKNTDRQVLRPAAAPASKAKENPPKK